MEKQIEEVTTITSDDDELSDNNDFEFQYIRRVPFPEFGTDIIDGEHFSFYCEYYVNNHLEISINIYKYLYQNKNINKYQ